MSTHGRSASYGSGGWFSGTMEVISGMAPRPSTPQGLPHGKMGPRSLSAPNSPARPGSVPSIARLPSQDSLDRSIHNESGHGKSTAQIIRDLKQANASLTAKQAAQEARSMNELSELTRSFEDQRLKMDADIRDFKKQVAHLEAYKSAANNKLKETSKALSEEKVESGYLRQTISEMKSQMYQLQMDLDGVQQSAGGMINRSSQEEMLLADNQEMARQVVQLRAELRDSERARHELERSKGRGKPPAPPNASGESPSGYYQKFQETHSELEQQRKRLSVTQTKMEGLEAEKQTLEKAHATTVEELQADLVKQSELFQRREQDLETKIEALEAGSSSATRELQRDIEARDKAILNLQDELEQCAERISELGTQLERAQHAAANQENYRRDEAEDLRILHDAQEEEISKLRKQLEDTRKEVDMRDEELQESKGRLETFGASSMSSNDDVVALRNELEETKTKLDDAQRKLGLSSDREVDVLRNELSESKQKQLSLEAELTNLKIKHEKSIERMEASVEELATEKKNLTSKLDLLEREKNDAVSEYEAKITEFSTLRSHWEGKAGAVNEAETLKSEIDIHKQRAFDASEKERAANTKILQLNERINALEKELADEKETAKSLQETVSQANSDKGKSFEATKKDFEEAQMEVEQLREAIQVHEKTALDTEKQLREAQIALVALDDEKKSMSVKHRELLLAVENKKEEIQRTSDESLSAKEQQITKLSKRIDALVESEARSISEMKNRLKKAEAFESEEIKKLRKEISELQSYGLNQQVSRHSTSAIPVSPDSTVLDYNAHNGDELKLTIEKLRNINEALKTKLKDRDTTISALVRSSVSLETKIANMESEVNEARSLHGEEKKAAEEEVQRNSVRRRLTLETPDYVSTDSNVDIAMLHQELEENAEKLKERDQAIENLVNQSLSQDAHVKDLKTRLSSLMKEMEKRSVPKGGALESEVERLQQETEMFAGQIIEQDEELQNLRRQLQLRDEEIIGLNGQVSVLKKKIEDSLGSSGNSEEVERLRSDVERITTDLRARDEEIQHLQTKLTSSENKLTHLSPDRLQALEAELDEMRDASRDDRAELRDLRKQLWESKQSAGETSDLKLELAQAKYAFDEFKRKHGVDEGEDKKLVAELKAKVIELEASARDLKDDEIIKLREQLTDLQTELATKQKSLDKLTDDVKSKDAAIEKSELLKLKILGELSDTKQALRILHEQTSENARNLHSSSESEKEKLEIEKAALIEQKENLSSKVTELQEKVEKLEMKQKDQSKSQVELEKAQCAREASEKSIVDAYEKQIAALSQDKDTTIDNLRDELANVRHSASQEADEIEKQLKALQAEKDNIGEQFNVELQNKNQQIYALEHTLHAQEQIVQSMRAEMDQLQSGMEHATEKRRGEVEDLQKELMEIEGRSLKQEREITTLKMQLEEGKLEHKTEVVRLKEMLANLEKEGPLAKTVASLQNDDRMLEVRERLEQLKARNTALQEENLKLGGRLERKVIEIKSLEFEKSRAEDLDKENSSLRRQVKELGAILESGRPKQTRPSSSSKESPATGHTSPSAPNSTTTSEKHRSGKSKKGLKGLFKRREVTVIEEGDEDAHN